MPDFSQKQAGWNLTGAYTWSGPVAAADSLWWLDSEYESLVFANAVPPPMNSDHFPLVTAYGPWDDHNSRNVIPLVVNLSYLMDTDGIQTHDGHVGTRWQDLENGTKYYLAQQGLAKYFEVHNKTFPDFAWISSETLNCQDVELFLEFYYWDGTNWWPFTEIPGWQYGHYVTCAGVNVTTNQLLISDPWQDAYEAGKAPGRSPVAHPAHPGNTTVHNDAQYVSQDAYNVTAWIYGPPPMQPPPDSYPSWTLIYNLQGYLQTMGYNDSYVTFIRAAVATSPVPQWPGYTKPAYPDYAPAGMPDFSELQDNWGPDVAHGFYTWCAPVAVADSLWWLDSECESLVFANPVPPPAISDHFNLVNSSNPGGWDDHDPHFQAISLITTLATLMDTDGMSSHDGHNGTRWNDVQTGIQKYLAQQGVAGMFEVHNQSFPDFAWIDNQTESCQGVGLCIEFWYWNGLNWEDSSSITTPIFRLGHMVTCAGVNVTTSQVLVCDPGRDAYEAGWVPGRSLIPHNYPHNSAVHNDAQYVSQDAYNVSLFNFTQQVPPEIPRPPGFPETVWELDNFAAGWHAFIVGAVATSPILNIVPANVESAKDNCTPMATVGKGYTTNVSATVVNQGSTTQDLTVTVYANYTALGTTTVEGLAPGANVTVTVATWNTSTWAYGKYFLTAATNASIPTFTSNVTVWVVLPGDINGDGTVDLSDAIILSGSFLAQPGDSSWNPNADIVEDGIVDLSDAIVLSGGFLAVQVYDP
jgi:hypothetical protein